MQSCAEQILNGLVVSKQRILRVRSVSHAVWDCARSFHAELPGGQIQKHHHRTTAKALRARVPCRQIPKPRGSNDMQRRAKLRGRPRWQGRSAKTALQANASLTGTDQCFGQSCPAGKFGEAGRPCKPRVRTAASDATKICG